MTTPANDRRAQITASAAQTIFTYNFKIIAKEELRIEKRAVADDTVTLLVEGAGNDYTVTGVGDAGGGTFILTSGATLNDIYTCNGATSPARGVDYSSALRSGTLNADQDEIYRIINELQRGLSRAIQMPQSDDDDVVLGADMILPLSVDRALKFLKFDADGKVELVVSNSLFTGPVVSTDQAITRFDGTTGLAVQNSIPLITDAGALLFDDGTVSLPGAAFVDEPDSGLYRIGANNLGIAVGGVKRIDINGTINQFAGSTIAGDPGTEGAGISIGGVTFESSLKVSDLGGTNAAQFIVHRHSTTLPAIIIGSRSKTNDNTHAAVIADDDLLSIYGVGHDGVDGYELAASITMSVDGAPGDGDMPGRITFNVTPNAAATPVEALRINSVGQLVAKVGTAALPEYTFTGDLDTGMFWVGANTIGFSGGGTAGIEFRGTGMRTADGVVGAPSHGFISDTDMGFYLVSAGVTGWTVGGVKSAELKATGLGLVSGTAADPSFRFLIDEDTGMYRAGANTLGFATAGAAALILTSTGRAQFVDGSAASPSITFASDTDTGIYRVTANTLGIVAGGDVIATFQNVASGVESFRFDNGSVGAGPKIQTQGGTNVPLTITTRGTGQLSFQADTIVFSSFGGTERMRINSSGALDLATGTSGGILTDAQSLPTSDPTTTGQLWNNAGVVNVSA